MQSQVLNHFFGNRQPLFLLFFGNAVEQTRLQRLHPVQNVFFILQHKDTENVANSKLNA